jgi:peptide/nickel transport system substrate-binding protein
MMLSRRGLMTAATAVAGLPAMPGHAASPQILRIGMTAADLPSTHGIPNNGGEGFRFLGYPAYDSIVNWDFGHTDKLADITPGLFTAWHADETNPLRWICTVREGVTFHDGSAFDADAVIWNFGRVYDSDRASDTVDDR